MNEFEDLDIPKEALHGWYVVSLVNGVHYLHEDCRIHTGTQDSFSSSTGYFTTEGAAYACARRYYTYHSIEYPYIALADDSQKVNDGSQQMNFG